MKKKDNLITVKRTSIDVDDLITAKGTNSNIENIKMAKFEIFIEELYKTIGCGTSNNKTLKEYEEDLFQIEDIFVPDPSLSMIFEFDEVNDYAKVIMRTAMIDPTHRSQYTGESCCSWCVEKICERIKKNQRDVKERIEDAKTFVEACREERNKSERYKFIFWSLMILAVDKTDVEEHLSLTCNFAKMLQISDDEIEDIIYIVKLVFNEWEGEYSFKTDTVLDVFSNTVVNYS